MSGHPPSIADAEIYIDVEFVIEYPEVMGLRF
jgi:hypothetical protein